ncbi:MAG: Swt1 family HEPN domain-containing protein [Chloroflexota bacterium]|nr:Swt1 family HEPN domain-containing protein [Chloroflexota bacterium]MDE2962126.1 Swt1 family HEPN domain-containing protein [Chloroflexota bacterium]
MTAPAAYNNHSLIGEALRLLASGLGPYVAGKMSEAVDAGHYIPDDSEAVGEIAGDIAVTLRVMTVAWNDVFRDALGPAERSLVSEIRETRNRWAHQDAFDEDDLDRALDSIGRLLAAVGAIAEAKRIDGAKHRLRLRRYGAPSPKATDADAPARDETEEPEPAGGPAGMRPMGRPGDVETRPTVASDADADARPAESTAVDDSARDQLLQNHIIQGVDLRRREHFGHAMGEFEQALGINPDRADAWFHRGMTWGLMGDHGRAIADFNRAIAIASDYAEAYNCRGYAYFCLGEYRRAVEDLERADRLNPGDELIQGNLQQARMRFLQQPGNPDPTRYGSGQVPER